MHLTRERLNSKNRGIVQNLQALGGGDKVLQARPEEVHPARNEALQAMIIVEKYIQDIDDLRLATKLAWLLLKT